MAIGRVPQQAPEVDGLTVVLGRNLVPGTVVWCGILRVNGVDLEAVPINNDSGLTASSTVVATSFAGER